MSGSRAECFHSGTVVCAKRREWGLLIDWTTIKIAFFTTFSTMTCGPKNVKTAGRRDLRLSRNLAPGDPRSGGLSCGNSPRVVVYHEIFLWNYDGTMSLGISSQTKYVISYVISPYFHHSFSWWWIKWDFLPTRKVAGKTESGGRVMACDFLWDCWDDNHSEMYILVGGLEHFFIFP